MHSSFINIATLILGYLLGKAGENLTRRLRLETFRNILRQDSSYFDDPRNSAGKLTVRLATDAPNVQAAIDIRLANAGTYMVSLIGGAVVACYFGWQITLVSFTTAILLMLTQMFVFNYLRKRGRKDLPLSDDLAKIGTESIEYARTVQALTREQTLLDAFDNASKAPTTAAIYRGFWYSLSYSFLQAFVHFNFGITYTIGLFFIKFGYTTPFVLFQVIESLNTAAVRLMTAGEYIPEYILARISAAVMFSIMNTEPKIDSLSEIGDFRPIYGSLTASDISFLYPNGRQLALNSFTLHVPLGKTIALVGPSGCGKSTFIQLLERYYDAVGGSIQVDGWPIQRYNIRHLRQALSIVTQLPVLFNLTIRENIIYGLTGDQQPTPDAIVSAAKLANIHSFIDSLPLKYDTLVGSHGTLLSGGQKQRIAIARAIIRNPKILLLDEATSALDTESERIVQEALDKARSGRTCLVIAHRLSTIVNADLIVVMRDGRAVETGNHQQLLARKGLYYRMVQKKFAPKHDT